MRASGPSAKNGKPHMIENLKSSELKHRKGGRFTSHSLSISLEPSIEEGDEDWLRIPEISEM